MCALCGGLGFNVHHGLEEELPDTDEKEVVLLLPPSGSPQEWSNVIEKLQKKRVIAIIGTSFTTAFIDQCAKGGIAACTVSLNALKRMRADINAHPNVVCINFDEDLYLEVASTDNSRLQTGQEPIRYELPLNATVVFENTRRHRHTQATVN
ncbi:MAG: hypothetical protein WDZ82_01140 [Candidatus Paceibacterota bacterium]